MPVFVKKIAVFKVINMCVKQMSSPYAVFIGIRRMNCYVICLLNCSCHFVWEETYISNITSLPDLSVFLYVNIINIIIIVCLNAE